MLCNRQHGDLLKTDKSFQPILGISESGDSIAWTADMPLLYYLHKTDRNAYLKRNFLIYYFAHSSFKLDLNCKKNHKYFYNYRVMKA